MADSTEAMEPWDKKMDRIRGLAATDRVAFYTEVGVKMVYDPDEKDWPFHGLEHAFYEGKKLYAEQEVATKSTSNMGARAKESSLVSRAETPVPRTITLKEVRDANSGFLCVDAVLQKIESLDLSAVDPVLLAKYRELAAKDLSKFGISKSEYGTLQEWEAEAMKSCIWKIRMESVDDKQLGFLTRSCSGAYDCASANRVYSALRDKLIGEKQEERL